MSIAVYCVFGCVLFVYCMSRFCLNVINCTMACFIFFLAFVECSYSMLVFCWGGFIRQFLKTGIILEVL